MASNKSPIAQMLATFIFFVTFAFPVAHGSAVTSFLQMKNRTTL